MNTNTNVTVVIVVPDLYPSIRRADMPLDEAVDLVREIKSTGSFIGAPATAFIDAAPPAPVATPAPEPKRKRPTYEPLTRVASCVTTPRKVRASSGRWRGESGGTRYERIATERTPQYTRTGVAL